MATYQLHSWRWVMLVMGFYVNFVVWTVEQPFTPSASFAASYLGVSVTAIHWLKYAWSLAAVVSALPGLWLVEKLGLRKAGCVSALTLLLGVALRGTELGVATSAGVKESSAAYSLVLIGSIVAAVAVIPIQAMTTFIAASWFDDGWRGLANTLVRE